MKLLRYFYINSRRLNTILRCMNRFWERNLIYFHHFTYPILKYYQKKKEKFRQHRYFYRILFIIILLFIIIILFLVNLIKSFLSTSNTVTVLETYNVYKSQFLSANESLVLNIHNQSIHHIYIDIGCYNGESVEHFIHFFPESSFYDIITFEPDPYNYELCKNRLTQTKYRNYNIIIIPKVVWIRDEEVLFQTNRGQSSRMSQNGDNDNSLTKLDGINFSSWLSRLITSNKTKIYVKVTTPEMEVELMEKMILDDTLTLADRWEVQWTDRTNPRKRPKRLYVQLMLDSLGYQTLYGTRLRDVRNVFKINGTYDNVTKYIDWSTASGTDIHAHYSQRPIVYDPPRTIKTKLKLKHI